MILDVTATKEGRGPDLDLVRELSEDCYIPITVGGGVKSLQDIDNLLRAGADKVCIGAALRPENYDGLLRDASDRFGRQALVAIANIPPQTTSTFAAIDAGWKAAEGAGEILLQSMERDGLMTGYDLDTIRAVSAAVSIPVIASCGCSGYPDMLEAFKAGADACAVGALFAFTDATPRGAAKFLAKHLEVRL
jgi:cyclase